MAYYRYNKELKVWTQIEASDKLDTDIKLEERLIPVLEAAKRDLKRDLDFALIIFGSVGSGKSTLGRLMCRYVSDEKFHPRKHMVRDVNDIGRIMKGAKKGDAIVFDEASGIFGSADTMTKKTKYAQLVLDVCRQKNLFMVIIAPQFHRLTAPVAVDRTKIALRTFIHKKTMRRGHFAFYGTKLKEKMYIQSKKQHGSLKGIIPKWHGEFGEELQHDEEYRIVKDETLNMVLDSFGGKSGEKQPTPTEIEQQTKKELVYNNPDMSSKVLAKMIGVTQWTINNWRRDFKEQINKKKLIEAYSNPSQNEI